MLLSPRVSLSLSLSLLAVVFGGFQIAAPAQVTIVQQTTLYGNTPQQVNQQQYNGSGTFSQSNVGSSATSTVALSPFPFVSVSSIAAVGDFKTHAYGTLRYAFTVVGPANVQVPIILTGYIDLGFTNYGSGFARLNVREASQPAQNWDREYSVQNEAVGNWYAAGAPVSDNFPLGVNVEHRIYNGGLLSSLVTTAHNVSNEYTFSFSYAESVSSNALSYVNLAAGAGGDDPSVGFLGPRAISSSGHALIDPIIFIDPSFSDANLFSIVITPEVANATRQPAVSAVPEPSTYGILAGLGLAFLAIRRRKFSGKTAA